MLKQGRKKLSELLVTLLDASICGVQHGLSG